MPPESTVQVASLSELQAEQLRRFRAEWALHSERAERARERFEGAAGAAARGAGIEGDFELDLDAAMVRASGPVQHDNGAKK